MEYKTCSFCGETKPVSEFPIDYRYKPEVRYLAACKKCRRDKYYDKEKNKEYRKKSESKPEIKKKRKEYFTEYRKRDKYKEYHKSEKIKEYHRNYNTTQEYRDYKNKYRIDNYDLVRGREREREKSYNQRPEVRIKRALRARLLGILKRGNGSKSSKMVELVGCTMPFLRDYLQSLWKEGMSWDNYGFGRGKWVMDHIVACDKFDLTDKEQQKLCFNYKNLQPLWWEENATKSNK